jgi:DNA-binding SARP family transcriptional activator
MDFGILGPFVVTGETGPLDVGGPKPRGLLTVLAMQPGQVVSNDLIVDILWGERPPRAAVASLHSYVSTLRRTLEPHRPPRKPAAVLLRRGDGYVLAIHPDQVDAGKFEHHARFTREALREGRAAAALHEADAGLVLWRGRALDDLSDSVEIIAWRVRLEELRRALVEDRTEAAMRSGLPVVGDCEAMISADPLRERPWLLLVEALAREGRVSDALDRYRRHRRLLDDELGIAPSEEMEQLQLRLLDGGSLQVTPVDTATSVTGAAPDRTALVGREAEVEQLVTALDAVASGRVVWAVLAGEPGVGKTVLAQHVTDVAQGRGMRVAWGRCPEDGDAPPFWPIDELLRDLGGPTLEELGIGDRGLGEQARTFRLYEAVGSVLDAASATQPVVLVVDDLQWADAATVRLLSFLASRTTTRSLLVVATLRAGEDQQSVGSLLAALTRFAHVDRLQVSPLDRRALAQLARGIKGADLDDEAAERLWERTSGNPFYATELLRLPVGEWRGDVADVPPGVRDVVRRRLGRLGLEVVELLTVGAAIGLEFDLELLLEASDRPLDGLLTQLDTAIEAGLLEGQAGRFHFTHALVRDTLTSDLTFLGRQRLHARLADALGSLPVARRRLRAGEIARHRIASADLVDVRTVVRAVRAAAEQAASGLAHEQAVMWLTTALEFVAGDPTLSQDHDLRSALLLERGRGELVSGDAPAGWASLSEAFDVAAASGNAKRQADAMIALRTAEASWLWVPFRMQPHELVRRLEHALSDLPEVEVTRRVALLVTLAEGLYYIDRHRSAMLAEEALVLAREHGRPAELADAMIGYLIPTWLLVPPAGHLELLDAYAALPGRRSLAQEARTTLHRWRVNVQLGRREEAERAMGEARSLASDSMLPAVHVETAWASLTHRILCNQLENVAGEIEQIFQLHERSGMYAARALRALHVVLMHWWQGRALEDDQDRVDLVTAQVGALEFSALVALGRGNREGARSLLGAAIEPLPDDWTRGSMACLRGWVAAKAGCPDVAAATLDDLLLHADELDVFGTGAAFGPVALYLGVVHRCLGNSREAASALRTAIAHGDGGLGGPWATMARMELADLLQATGHGPEKLASLFAAARGAAAGSPELLTSVVERERRLMLGVSD